MIRLLIKFLLFLGSAALGILAAASLIDGVSVQLSGFIAVVVIYAVIQAVTLPFITRMAALHASALLGGTGLVAALVALLAASTWGDSLTIEGGVSNWIAATVVVWVVTALATLLLPAVLVKAGVEAAKGSRERK